ncbi:hypothetical protein ACFWGD_13000, partial [Corynebacterium sp. NPDC060344]
MTGPPFGEQPNPDGHSPSAPVGFGPPIEPRGPGAFGPPPQPWPVAPAAPAPAPARDRFTDRPGTVVVAVLVAVLLAIGGGVFATVRSDRGQPAAQDGKDPATPSGSPSVDQGDGKGPGA